MPRCDRAAPPAAVSPRPALPHITRSSDFFFPARTTTEERLQHRPLIRQGTLDQDQAACRGGLSHELFVVASAVELGVPATEDGGELVVQHPGAHLEE